MKWAGISFGSLLIDTRTNSAATLKWSKIVYYGKSFPIRAWKCNFEEVMTDRPTNQQVDAFAVGVHGGMLRSTCFLKQDDIQIFLVDT